MKSTVFSVKSNFLAFTAILYCFSSAFSQDITYTVTPVSTCRANDGQITFEKSDLSITTSYKVSYYRWGNSIDTIDLKPNLVAAKKGKNPQRLALTISGLPAGIYSYIKIISANNIYTLPGYIQLNSEDNCYRIASAKNPRCGSKNGKIIINNLDPEKYIIFRTL